MPEKSPLEKLDTVLSRLEQSYGRYNNIGTYQLLSQHSTGIEFGEVQHILDKLTEDGYLKMQEVPISGTESTDRFYLINFKGRIFNAQGGYVRLKELSDQQLKDQAQLLAIQRGLFYLTLALVLGTIVAAFYYGIEIYKFFSGHP